VKITEFRKLIREEVHKVLREATVKVPSDGIVRDHKGTPQVQFTKKGNSTEIKSLRTGKTYLAPMSIEDAYNKLFSVGQIDTNDGLRFDGQKEKKFNQFLNDLNPSNWKRFLTAPNAIKPGTKGEDINMYPLTVVAGPFDSLEAVQGEIKSKYPKAMDIFKYPDLVGDLKRTKAKDVEGFYLVKGPDYGGSGFTIVNGEDITV
jgi:hypothetical protein